MLNISRRSALSGAAALAASACLIDAKAQSKRVLIIAGANDITNFDPHASTDEPTTFLMRNTYDALVRVKGDPPKIYPQLASSWTVSPSGTEYLFKLDPAARFHDGSPVTAEAVVYSFERLLRLKKGNAWMIAGVIEPGGVQAVDAATVRIKLAQPFEPLLQVLPWLWIVNPKLVEANKGADDGQTYLRSNFASSGSFVMRRAEPGNLYELERAPNGWHKDGGNTTGVIYKIVRESSNQRLLVQRGDVHMALNLATDDVTALVDKPGILAVIEPELRTFMFRMNNKHGPLTDVNLRKALSHAVDYKAMLDVAVYAREARGPIPKALFGFDPSLTYYTTDLARAKEYLAKTKYAQGGLSLTLAHISGYEQQRRWSLILLDNFAKLGVELKIKPMNWADMVAAARTPENCPDLFAMFTSINYADPADVTFNHYHSARMGNWSNPTYSSPEVDALITQGRSESRADKRKQIYSNFQKQIIADAPDLFIAADMRKLIFRKNVRGFTFTSVRPGAFDLSPISVG